MLHLSSLCNYFRTLWHCEERHRSLERLQERYGMFWKAVEGAIAILGWCHSFVTAIHGYVNKFPHFWKSCDYRVTTLFRHSHVIVM